MLRKKICVSLLAAIPQCWLSLDEKSNSKLRSNSDFCLFFSISFFSFLERKEDWNPMPTACP